MPFMICRFQCTSYAAKQETRKRPKFSRGALAKNMQSKLICLQPNPCSVFGLVLRCNSTWRTSFQQMWHVIIFQLPAWGWRAMDEASVGRWTSGKQLTAWQWCSALELLILLSPGSVALEGDKALRSWAGVKWRWLGAVVSQIQMSIRFTMLPGVSKNKILGRS